MSADPASGADYARQVTRWVDALSHGRDEEILADLKPGTTLEHVRLFSEDLVEKRFSRLQEQLAFVSEAFDGLDDVLRGYLRGHTAAAYASTSEDAEAFLIWLGRAHRLTAEQDDYVTCQRARHAVEARARADRAGLRRFQGLLDRGDERATRTGPDSEPRVVLNPTRRGARFVSAALLDDITPPADVIFFAAHGEIRTAIVEPQALGLVERLDRIGPCPLSRCIGPGEVAVTAGLRTIVQDLTDIGLAALDEGGRPW